MVEKKPIAVGDEVAYSAAFMRNTGQHTRDTPFRRGMVIESEPLGDHNLCRAHWTDGNESSVLDVNLAHPGSQSFSETLLTVLG